MNIYIVDAPFGDRLDISIAELHREAVENNELITEGVSGFEGLKHTEETKRRMSLAWDKRRKVGVSKETRKKQSESAKNRVFSDETRKKISKANSGKKNGMYGKTHHMKGKKRIEVECNHCGKVGGEGVMGRWHFGNCKRKRTEAASN